MSDKGEKVCPICTEEMDLTDQQLKPCKCGYEICVWCWNHIMEMAEKDNTEGRCPACRTPYDKEKIVAMASNCERLVAEINSERKQRSQKAKPKASEGKMHLSNVRVIQRNLVYIIGLPLNLADEELLQHGEYFGQYGKVLKVSISRTATGAIQHSANNSCCVYITYSKEEDAIRCIQSVHSFVLEGRPLRACFGTTKYCHAWLRNMPCSIPDCLYLHDFGSEEDSFTKDDLVSAFQRSKVQQIIGSTNNMHRSGNVLPPPADNGNGNRLSTGRSVAKNPCSNVENQNKGSCTDGVGPGRCNAVPAAASWVMRVSGGLPPASNSSYSVGPPSCKPEICDGLPVLASDAVSAKRSMQDFRAMTEEESCKVHVHGELDPLELAEGYNDSSCHIALSNTNAGSTSNVPLADVKAGIQAHCLPASKGIDRDIAEAPTSRSSQEATKPLYSPVADDAENVPADEDFQELCSGLSSVSIHSRLKNPCSGPVVSNSLVPNHNLVYPCGSQGSVQDTIDQFKESSTSLALRETINAENLQNYGDGQLKGFEDICHLPSTFYPPSSLLNLNSSNYRSWQEKEFNYEINPEANPRFAHMKLDEVNFPMTSGKTASSDAFSNSFADLDGTFGYSSVLSEVRLGKYLEGCSKNIASVDNSVTSDTGESSIISKILSIDLDTWEDSLASPQTLVKLLSDTDKQHGCLKVPSVRKLADSKQSRFSFARQEDFFNSGADECSTLSDLEENKGPCMGPYNNIFPSFCSVELDNNFSTFPKYSGSLPLCPETVSKSPSSTPPGFSVPFRAPPPGFPSHGRMQKTLDDSASHLLQSSAPMAQSVGGFGDIEFVDPAILEVGKGMQPTGMSDPSRDMRPPSSVQLSPFDFDAGLQQLMRQSVSEHHNLAFPNHLKYSLSPQNENHSISPIYVDQFQPNYHSAFAQSTAKPLRNMHTSNGGWDLWNDVKTIGDLGVSELVAKQGMGLNNFLPSYEDLRSQMSSSSNLYNRGFAM